MKKTKKSKKLATLPIKSKMHGDDDVGNEDDWEDFNAISEVNIQSWISVYEHWMLDS